MQLALKTSVRVAKLGQTLRECEDYGDYDLSRGVVAVSDGASTSAFPARWASVLASSFLESPDIAFGPEWLGNARKRFISELQLQSLPWHALEKLQRGAFAAFVGLWLDAENSTFSAIAAGDSVLSWVPPQGKPGLLPSSPHFSQTPYLVSSLGEQNQELESHVFRIVNQGIEPGTTFLLMTDSLGDWFVNEMAAGRKPWRLLSKLDSRGLLHKWVDERREDGTLANDDVTLIVMEAQG